MFGRCCWGLRKNSKLVGCLSLLPLLLVLVAMGESDDWRRYSGAGAAVGCCEIDSLIGLWWRERERRQQTTRIHDDDDDDDYFVKQKKLVILLLFLCVYEVFPLWMVCCLERGFLWRGVGCGGGCIVQFVYYWFVSGLVIGLLEPFFRERERERGGIVNQFLRIYSLLGDLWRRF